MFNRKDYLERHAANHLFVKPFVCKLCDRQFSRKDLYDNHLMTKRHARAVLEAESVGSEYRPENHDIDQLAKRRSPDSDGGRARDEGFTLPYKIPGYGASPESYYPDTRYRYYAESVASSVPSHAGFYAASRTGLDPPYAGRRGSAFVDARSAYGGYGAYSTNYNFETGSQASLSLSIASSTSSHPWSDYGYSGGFGSAMPPYSRHAPFARSEFSTDFSAATSPMKSVGGVSLPSLYDIDRPENYSPVQVVEEWLRRFYETHDAHIIDFRAPLDHTARNNSVSDDGMCVQVLRSSATRTEPGAQEATPAFQDPGAGPKPADGAGAAGDTGMARLSKHEGIRDKRFAWFFDDCFETDKSKYGYDRYYTEILGTYKERLAKLRPAALRSGDIGPVNDVCRDTAVTVLRILGLAPEEMEDDNVVSQWVQTAWTEADAVSHCINPATFVADEVHTSLVVVLALLGMTLDADKSVSDMALHGFASAFLYVYECLLHLPPVKYNQLDTLELSKLQAFSLMMRIDQVLFKEHKQHECFVTSKYGRLASNVFLTKVLPALPRAGTFEPRRVDQPTYATLYQEGYMFHEGANPEAQWREWVGVESLKRAVMALLYYDTIYSLTMESMDPVSLFHMDFYMIAPDPLWYARSATQFFDLIGETRMIPAIPYLALLKAVIRFPRMPKFDCIQTPMDGVLRFCVSHNSGRPPPTADFTEEDRKVALARYAWGPFALKSLSQGLIIVLSTFSGVLPKQTNDALTLLMHSHSSAIDQAFKKLNFDLQLKLYRGLDVWRQLFLATYGDLTDRVLQLPGSTYLPLKLDLDRGARDENATPHFSILMILIYYSSYIYVHEDLPIVLEITSNLKQWLNLSATARYDTLADYLYMPLYKRWIDTDDARGMIGACILYLLWLQSSYGQVYCKNQKFMSAIIYISGVVVWLYDYVSHEFHIGASGERQPPGSHVLDDELELEEFKFMKTGTKYLQATFERLMGRSTEPVKGVKSVLLLTACLLHQRSSTEPWVETLTKLLSVMDSKYTQLELLEAVKQSAKLYENRFKILNSTSATSSRPASKKGSVEAEEPPTLTPAKKKCLFGADKSIGEPLDAAVSDLSGSDHENAKATDALSMALT